MLIRNKFDSKEEVRADFSVDDIKKETVGKQRLIQNCKNTRSREKRPMGLLRM